VMLAEIGVLSDHLHQLHVAGMPDAVNASLPLVMTLMVERRRGRKSPWAAYLDFVSTEPDLPSIYWTVCTLATCECMYV
jgi:hypothetical protein